MVQANSINGSGTITGSGNIAFVAGGGGAGYSISVDSTIGGTQYQEHGNFDLGGGEFWLSNPWMNPLITSRNLNPDTIFYVSGITPYGGTRVSPLGDTFDYTSANGTSFKLPVNEYEEYYIYTLNPGNSFFQAVFAAVPGYNPFIGPDEYEYFPNVMPGMTISWN